MDKKLLEVAAGRTPADIVVKNGKIVNVYTKEIDQRPRQFVLQLCR